MALWKVVIGFHKLFRVVNLQLKFRKFLHHFCSLPQYFKFPKPISNNNNNKEFFLTTVKKDVFGLFTIIINDNGYLL